MHPHNSHHKPQHARWFVAVFFFMFIASLILTSTAEAQSSDMEACISCSTGNRGLRQNAVMTGTENFRRIDVNVFDPSGQDPRQYLEQTSPGSGGSAIGHTRTYGPVDFLEPVASEPTQTTVVRGVGQGNGFLVSPCLMLTNYHAVFGNTHVRPDPNSPHFVRFEIGQNANGTPRHSLIGIAAAWGNYSEDPDDDWAIVKLSTCVGSEPDIGWVPTTSLQSVQSPSARITLMGYPGERLQNQLSVQRACELESANDAEVVKHYCSTTAGSSGSPLFVNVNGVQRAFAMHYYSPHNQPGVIRSNQNLYANRAISLEWIFNHSQLRSWIENDIRNPGHPFESSIPSSSSARPS